MNVKMAFGLIVSAVLAYGVLSLAGLFRDGVTAFGIVPGMALTAIYFMAFRAAAAGRTRAAAVSTIQVMQWESEEETVAAAAAA